MGYEDGPAPSALQWDMGVSTFTGYDEDGFPTVQTDLYGEDKAGEPAFEMHHWAGWLAIPLDPVKDSSGQPDEANAAPHLFAREGDKAYGWALGDPRSLLRVGLLNKGSAMAYAPGGPQFIKLDATRNKITIFTTDNGFDTGRSVYWQVHNKGFLGVSSDITLRADDTGFHILTRGGARMDGGYAGMGLPAPLDQFSSYWTLAANMIEILGTFVVIGDGAADSVAKVEGFKIFMTTFAAAVATAVASSGAPLGGAAASAFAGAVSAMLQDPALALLRTTTRVS